MQGDPKVEGYSRAELAAWSAEGRPFVTLDVRSAEEFAKGTAVGARHVPPDALEAFAAASDPGVPVVAVCNHGGSRSRAAAATLRSRGVLLARHLVGGVHGA